MTHVMCWLGKTETTHGFNLGELELVEFNKKALN